MPDLITPATPRVAGAPAIAPDLMARALADMDLPGPPAASRVVVAMSGGVDSSVTAALLAAAGYDVVGVTLQLYDHGAALAKKGACCAGADIHDARRVADALNIPHYVLDYENAFRQSVMDDFADTYLAGATPIPCVRCNQTVKFTDLLGVARDLGAAAMATGHYIRRAVGPDGPELRRAADADRDQSYFLFATTAQQLDFLRFPLGGLTKPDVRDLAGAFGLAVADKPDSQDICFVPTGSYASVIEKLRPDAGEPGDIVHLDGRVLGRHDGVLHYTVGQRRGLGVATGEPLFVVRLDAPARRVIVGPREALGVHEVALKEVNWIGGGVADAATLDGRPVLVRVRSTRPPTPARLVARADAALGVAFETPEEGVAPGQAAVFYAPEGDRILGGGWITSTDPPPRSSSAPPGAR